MRMIKLTISILTWMFTFFIFFLTLTVILNESRPEISRDENVWVFEGITKSFSLIFLFINLGLVFIGLKIGIIKSNKIKLFLLIVPIVMYLGVLFFPYELDQIVLSQQVVNNYKIRADQRAFEGNWEQAIDIYCYIKPRINEQNPNISRIQSWLKKAGYYEYKINGIADYKILEQLKLFQQENNLLSDGIIGDNTQFILFNIIFKEQLDNIKSTNNIQTINEELEKFILLNNIKQYDNTKAILFGVMFKESLKLKDNELTISNLRAIVKTFSYYPSSGRFDNSILKELISLEGL